MKTTFALYFANRGFFPGELIADARKSMIKALEDAGYGYICMDENLTRYGAVETITEGKLFADFLKENEGKYDLAFTITLDGENEPIAETGLIPAGKSALKLKLTKPLEPGTYEATVLVQPYRVDDQSKTNNAEIKTVIIAE